jgi:hypothetical protein
MCCEVCGANPAHDKNAVLHRVNEFGVKGIWRCQDHFDGNIDPVTQDIIEVTRTK